MAHYLRRRPNLRLVFALVDSSLPPQTMDLEFVEWLADNSIPFVLVFTKTDKAKPPVVKANIAAFSERIAEWCETLPQIFTCSAVAKHGRRELLDVIDQAMAELDAEDPADSDEAPPGKKPAVNREASNRTTHGKGSKVARPW